MRLSHAQFALHNLVKQQLVPGVSYAILNHGEITTEVFGNAEILPEPKPLKPNQQYDLASLTKVIGTVPVILQLVEQHRLSLSDSISEYLPEWKYPHVTIRHLITHTSGITGYIPHRNQLNRVELENALLGLHIGKNFNTKMVYSDTNFVFLGMIAQKILKRPIQDLIQMNVFNRLNMTNSTFNPIDIQRCVPTDYHHGNLRQGSVEDPKAQILKSDCGSAGAFSTLSDLIIFVNEMLDSTGKLFDHFNINDFMHDQTVGGELGRSFGWSYYKHPEYLFQAGYTGTGIILQPVKKRALIFLTNRVHPQKNNPDFIPYRNQLIQTFINE